MITEQDLQAAIAECQGQRNPTASTCLKLAAFLTIKEHMYPDKKEYPETESQSRFGYSFANEPETRIENTVRYMSDTEFGQAIYGRKQDDLWPIMDELMTVVQAINPRLYKSVIRKIES